MASFGGFTFALSEQPIRGTFNGWIRPMSYDQLQPLGAAKTDAVLLATGSRRLTFSNLLTQARYDEAELLQGTVAVFEDWDRPSGNQVTALLESLTIEGWVVDDWTPSGRRLRVAWSMLEQ